MRRSTGRIAWPAALPRACAVAARRPASWLAAAVAASLPAWAAWSQAHPAEWWIVAVLASLAAVGDVPTGFLHQGARAAADDVVLWTVARGLWPAAGLCVGAVATGWPVAGGPAMAGAALVAAAVSSAAGRLCGARAADAAALAMLLTFPAAAVAVVAPVSGLARAGAAGLTWVAAAGLAWAVWSAHQRGGPLPAGQAAASGRRSGESAPVDPLPSSGVLRGWLGRLAMLTALVGMASWLVPDPAVVPVTQGDRWAQAGPRVLPWAAATAGWFLALAVPQAILQDGVAGGAAWERLWRTSVATGRRRRIGPGRFAAGTVLTQAAILGWPPLVAALLSLPSPATSVPPLAIVAGLLAGAGGVTAVMYGGARLSTARETLFALTLAVAGALVMGAWHSRAASTATISPILPSLGRSAS